MLCLCGSCKKKESPAENPAVEQSGNPTQEKPAAALQAEAEKAYAGGMALIKDGKYEEAVKRFSDAVKSDEKYGAGYLQRGICRAVLQEREEALKDLDRAVELMPENYDAFYQKAMLLYGGGPRDEAEHAFTDLAGRFPDKAAGCFYLGEISESRMDLPKALEWFSGAIEREPGHAKALAKRACLWAIFEDFDKALSDIGAARRIEGDNPDLRAVEGTILLTRGRWLMDRAALENNAALGESALADFKAAEKLFERSGGLMGAIGWNEAIASQSTSGAALYETTNKQFEKILADIEAGGNTRMAGAEMLVPRLLRDLAVADMARGDEKKAVERLEGIVKRARDFPALWEEGGVSVLDRWLTFRVICDAMHSLAKILVGAEGDYAAAGTYLGALKDFQELVKAEYGPAAEARKREREAVQEAIYECEYQTIVPAVQRQFDYEQCVKMLGHPYAKIRAAGLACLSAGEDPRMKEHVAAGLEDADERVVVVAAKIAEGKKMKAAAPKMAEAMKRCGADAAVAVMGAMGGLLKNSTTPEGDVVASEETRAAVPALIDALESGDARVREAGIRALSDITGRTLMYHFDDAAEARAAAVARWRDWWKEASKEKP
jgi:tetratricopeptide (TPR) repeat protein